MKQTMRTACCLLLALLLPFTASAISQSVKQFRSISLATSSVSTNTVSAASESATVIQTNTVNCCSLPVHDTSFSASAAVGVKNPSETLIAVPSAVSPTVYNAQTLAEQNAEPQSAELTLLAKSVNLETKTINITLLANNHTHEPIVGFLYSVIAPASEDGIPDSCQQTPFSILPGKTLLSLSHSYKKEAADQQLTIYCWDTWMQPLSEPVILPLTYQQTITELTLNQTDVTLILARKDTLQLTYQYQPADFTDPGIVYESLNPAVALVNSQGLVTPKGSGTTMIVAVTADGTAAAACQIRVISEETAIALNSKSVSLNTGTNATFQLKAAVTPKDAPNKNVYYESNNPKIAQVTNTGLIQAVAAGEAVITAKTGDGSAEARCHVTVTSAVTGIRLNKTSLVMWDYGMYTLKATVSGATNSKVTFTSSDDSVATVSDSGIVFAMAKGTATITAKAGTAKATCRVQVYREYDYTGSIAAHFESGDNPGSISGSGSSKSYGCFQLYAGSDGPKSFYNWLINSGFHKEFGNALKKAHQADGGKSHVYGAQFDKAWQSLVATDKDEFRSCQMAYCMSLYYEPLVNRLVTELNFYPDNYGLALKSALWSRAIQHGVGGAFNRIRDAFNTIGGFEGKTEKALITAIYNECGAVVSSPPSSSSVPMNRDSSIAVSNGLVGKYMKHFSNNSSSVQAGVWQRLHVTELNMLYDLLEKPPIVITP